MTDPDVVVLQSNVHGMDVDEYAAELSSRLPEAWEVAVARTANQRRELLATARIATGLELSEELVREARNLELFVCMYAGIDHLPLDALEERDIAVEHIEALSDEGGA